MTDPIEIRRPTVIELSGARGDINLPLPSNEIADRVLDGDVVVLKDAFDSERIHALRRQLM